MSAFTLKHFDTLAYVKKAKELGTSEELAEFQARQIESAIDVAIENIESKELSTKNDVLITKNDLKTEIAHLGVELIKWVFGTGVATIIALVGIIKYIY